MQLSLGSVEVIECLTKSDANIEAKLTIIEDINIGEKEKKQWGLKEIEEDLKNWGEF